MKNKGIIKQIKENKAIQSDSLGITVNDIRQWLKEFEESFKQKKSTKMTLEELKETDWYKERPLVIQQAIDKLPPIHLYKFKDSGKQCHVISFEEPESGKLEDVTCTVQKTGNGGAMDKMGLGMLDRNAVFGCSLNDFELWED